MKYIIVNNTMLFLALLVLFSPVMAVTCRVNGQEVPCDVFFAQYGWIFWGMFLIFLILGLMSLIKPDLILKYYIWYMRTVMGIKVTPTKRTRTFLRVFGIFFLLGALFILYFLLSH
jgi:hypothetical protein